MQAYEHALDLRTELQEWWESPSGQQVSRGWSKSRAKHWKNVVYPVGEIEAAKLKIAAPFYVTGEMVGLIEAASESMPETLFHQTDLPSSAGFVLLAKPLEFTDIHGKQYKWSAFAWMMTGDTPNVEDAHGIHITTYTHRQHDDSGFFEETDADADAGYPYRYGTLSLIHETTWEFGRSYTDPTGYQGSTIWNEDFEVTPETVEGSIQVLRQIHTFFLLAQQRLAHPQAYPASRGVRKRVGKSDPNRPIPDVRVITLRRYREKSESNEVVGGSREYTHRWIVTGYWRRTWYASEGRHKPQYIADYVAGPEDKPLKLKSTTFLFRR